LEELVMKKIINSFSYTLSLLYIITVFFIVTVSSAAAESVPGEKTVLDYYIQLPDKYFQCETENILRKKDKLALIKKKDLKKGYIQALTIDGSIPVEAALFTDDYMGIAVLAVNMRCSSGCMCRKLDFFFVSDGKLMKSDDGHLFPEIEVIEKAAGITEGYEFILSDDGKNIKVANEENGKVLLIIEWSGGTFNIK
jgi:hypothetical protein